MPQDLEVGRPFVIIGSDGKRYAYGIGFYGQVSDEVASLPFVEAHTASAIRSKGQWLAQPRTGPGGHTAMCWLEDFSEFANQPILPRPIDEPPVYSDDPRLRFFPDLEHGARPPMFPAGTDPITGETTFRPTPPYDRAQEMQGWRPRAVLPDAVRMVPGSPSPPVGKVTDPDAHRLEREMAEHDRQQTMSLRATNAQAARYVDTRQPTPAPVTRPAEPNHLLFSAVDPREARRAAA